MSGLHLPRRLAVYTAALVCLAAMLGCHSLRLLPLSPDHPAPPEKDKDQALAPPTKHEQRVAQYDFHSNFELQRNLPLFAELEELGEQVHRELQLPPSRNLVQVYIFEDRDRFEHFMQSKYPELPKRRAFFVAQPHGVGSPEELLVYTYWGDRVREDLRHELTHALLHSVLKNVPIWLDEGLAEYFELPPEKQGVNATHLGRLRHGATEFKPALARLEQFSQVQEMGPQEYQEAWAWVHLMLRDKPEARKALLAYLQQLRRTDAPGPLQPRLAAVYPNPDEALARHLEQIDPQAPTIVPTVQR
jgi:hypothetical protein